MFEQEPPKIHKPFIHPRDAYADLIGPGDGASTVGVTNPAPIPQPNNMPTFSGGLQSVAGAPPRVPHTASDPLLLEWNRKNSRKNQAAITRNMWEDYKARFIPYENAMMDSVGAHADVLGRVSQGVDDAFSVMNREQSHRLGSYGVSMRPDEQQAFQRNMGLQHASAKAGATNTARMALRDRDLATLGGGLGSLSEQRHSARQ